VHYFFKNVATGLGFVLIMFVLPGISYLIDTYVIFYSISFALRLPARN